MQIDPHVRFLSDKKLEQLANDLLARYEQAIAPIIKPPTPVEEIADFLLELNIEWLDIADSDDDPVLAYLHPGASVIRFNQRRMDYFDAYPGTYEFTMAHELGHYMLHVTNDEAVPSDQDRQQAYLCRVNITTQSRREWQAERFASYLLMPTHLLLPLIENTDLTNWSNLYRLRDQFKVSISAMKNRLQALGLVHLAANGKLYPSQNVAADGLRRSLTTLMSQAHLHRNLKQDNQAREAFGKCIAIAQEIGDARSEARCAWELGLLTIDVNLQQAIALMSICVDYERRVGHPDAEADATYVAEIKAQA